MTLRRLAPLALAALAAACRDAQPCPSPLVECSGGCVDTQTDPHDCGACGQRCAGGKTCVGGRCTLSPATACPDRTGGAFVTLEHCGAAVKLWTSNPTFIAGAQAQLGLADPTAVASIALVEKGDCDLQWSWHADDLAVTFVASVDPSSSCTGCPATIQAEYAAGFPRARWCPAGARVVAVDERP